MGSPFLGEFLGTLVMILLGDGVVAGVLLKRSKAEGAGWMVITSGWAFAVMAGVFTALACGSKAAYLNPAVALGFAVSSGNYANLFSNVAAQLLGAFCGAVLVWIRLAEIARQAMEIRTHIGAPGGNGKHGAGGPRVGVVGGIAAIGATSRHQQQVTATNIAIQAAAKTHPQKICQSPKGS